MNSISRFITKHNVLVLIICLLLIIPAIYGIVKTRINYNILIYLPKEIETVRGEKILTEDFGLASYAFVIVDTENTQKILDLETKIDNIKGVDKVFSLYDALGTTVPIEMVPTDVRDALYNENKTIVFVTFKDTISSDSTIQAVTDLRDVVDDASQVSSMTSFIIDTKNISDQETTMYVVIAVLLCLIVLIIATDSYLMPLFLLGNIGVAILYNMGTNIIFGNISYITKAISAVLQLGVTTDFSIFLYHKYMEKKELTNDKKEAMALAIQETFKSLLGSSLTTFAGFLALCSMNLTLGKDIGLVMAKGVLFGLLTVLTLFPALILTFDNLLDKTKHKVLLPKFLLLQKFSIKNYKIVLVIFLIIIIPALYGNANSRSYYKLDETLPDYLSFKKANKELADRFNIISPQIIILDKKIKANDVNTMVEEIKKMDHNTFVIAPNSVLNSSLISILPKDITSMFDNDKYQLVVLNSTYEVASTELNNQIEEISKIVKKYDKNGIVAGEGALTKDLVLTSQHDFISVNYTSIFVILIIMFFVLQSLTLPFILIVVIESAIITNMACSFYMGVTLPFVASIVVGTIQLGATIDYAILMSTTYLNERKKIADKEEAMKNTLVTSVPSIITSALSFFAATVGVSLYTEIDMIGSICMLLSRGAIISMLVVVLLLPAFLFLFDKVIIKTTRLVKESD